MTAAVVLLIDDCLVEFGPGGAVQNLTTGFERHHRSTLSVFNLSSQVPEQESILSFLHLAIPPFKETLNDVAPLCTFQLPPQRRTLSKPLTGY
jgi:hypothetical protein